MAELKIQSLTKKYPSGVVAVDGVSFTVNNGECFALFGLDRSGKSTAMRMIAGLESVTSGNVSLGGKDITDLPTKARNMAFAFRDTALDNKETVYDNLAYGLRARKMPEPAIDMKVKAVAEILDLSDMLARKPKTLTALQRRRVILGRTMTRDPEVYLFDEPLSGLDKEMQQGIMTDLVKMQTRLGCTVLYATEEIDQAVALADRIAILHEGKIVQIGTPVELFTSPCDDFVREIMGSTEVPVKE